MPCESILHLCTTGFELGEANVSSARDSCCATLSWVMGLGPATLRVVAMGLYEML